MAKRIPLKSITKVGGRFTSHIQIPTYLPGPIWNIVLTKELHKTLGMAQNSMRARMFNAVNDVLSRVAMISAGGIQEEIENKFHIGLLLHQRDQTTQDQRML